jgi:hypothetical protein
MCGGAFEGEELAFDSGVGCTLPGQRLGESTRTGMMAGFESDDDG